MVLFAGNDRARPVKLFNQKEPRHFVRHSKLAQGKQIIRAFAYRIGKAECTADHQHDPAVAGIDLISKFN